MSVVAVGDIHGQSLALRGLLAQILPEMRPADTLVFLGDYIDRGPDSKGCIEEILRLKSNARFKVVTLMGNHEQWMMHSFRNPTKHGWLVAMDALPTIASYSNEVAILMAKALEEHGGRLFTLHLRLPYCAFFDAMPQEHLDFFEQLVAFHAGRNHLRARRTRSGRKPGMFGSWLLRLGPQRLSGRILRK